MTKRQKDAWKIAVHESGHVLVAMRFHVPVQFACVRRNWRIRSGGYVSPTYNKPVRVNGYPFCPWVAYSRIMLAGQAAEDVMNHRRTPLRYTSDVRKAIRLLWKIAWDDPAFEQLSKDERVNQIRRDLEDTQANLHKLFTRRRPNDALCHLSKRLYRRRILRRADLLTLRPYLARKGTACLPAKNSPRQSVNGGTSPATTRNAEKAFNLPLTPSFVRRGNHRYLLSCAQPRQGVGA